jgi:hypothetical protein
MRLFYLFLKGSTCFGRFLRPSSGAHNCTHSLRYCQPVLLQACVVDEMELRWNWDGTEMELRWNWDGTEMELRRNWDWTEMELRLNWDGTKMELRWNWDGTEIELRWNWDGTEMELNSISSSLLQVLVDSTSSCVYSYVLLMMGGGTARNM